MDINTRLDGFIVHPLDAFNDHHHDYDTPKFSSTAPHLDGFQEHPLDAFISQEHNNDISTNNYFNYEDTNQVNNYFPTNETLTADNLLNLNQNNNFDSTVYQPTQIQDLISTPTTYNNDYNYNYNKYDTTNFTTSEYPVTYTDPTPIPITTTTTTIYNNYNYTTTPSYSTISISPQTNYINTTSTYENYPSSTSNFNFSKILPPKILPAIKAPSNTSNINIRTSAPTIKLVPKITKKVTYATSSLLVPTKRVYSITSYPTYPTYSIRSVTPVINRTNFFSQIAPINTTSYRITSNVVRPATVLVNRPYRVVTFKPKIKWNNIIPQKQSIIVPKVRKYIVPRRTSIIIPQNQSVIIQNPPSLQPRSSIVVANNIQTPVIQQSQFISTPAPSNIIVPTISVVNPNVIQKQEKFPSDNFAGRSRILPNNNLNRNKIYYPKDVERKTKKKF